MENIPQKGRLKSEIWEIKHHTPEQPMGQKRSKVIRKYSETEKNENTQYTKIYGMQQRKN